MVRVICRVSTGGLDGFTVNNHSWVSRWWRCCRFLLVLFCKSSDGDSGVPKYRAPKYRKVPFLTVFNRFGPVEFVLDFYEGADRGPTGGPSGAHWGR